FVLQTASAATAIALRQYIYARLKTEEFISLDLASFTEEELQHRADSLCEAWEITIETTGIAGDLADQSLYMLDASTAGQEEPNVKAWAENLMKQCDAAQGGQTLRQLARQLNTDAGPAHEQLVLMQESIYNETMSAESLDKMTQIAQAAETACKVGLFTSADAEGDVMLSGVTCIADVADTGSSIILGENNRVTVSYKDIREKLAPVSTVVGLITLGSSDMGEQLFYIGDTLADWYCDGKVIGIGISGTEDGKNHMKAALVDAQTASDGEIEALLEEEGIPMSEQSGLAPVQLLQEYGRSTEEIFADLDSLTTQMAYFEMNDEQESESSMADMTNVDISGSYSGVLIGEDGEESQSEPVWIEDNHDGTITMLDEEGGETVMNYDSRTGEIIEDGFYLKFSESDGGITADGYNEEYDFSISLYRTGF
ncbi:MAG TPA: hypothetical protein PLU43_08760, partial [Lachnospiraceae bacterium]|nr:hypothetical protein [Lachnospiraceae bacterium]